MQRRNVVLKIIKDADKDKDDDKSECKSNRYNLMFTSHAGSSDDIIKIAGLGCVSNFCEKIGKQKRLTKGHQEAEDCC